MTEPKVRLLLFSGYKWENLQQKKQIYLANQPLAGRRATSFPGFSSFRPSHSRGSKKRDPGNEVGRTVLESFLVL